MRKLSRFFLASLLPLLLSVSAFAATLTVVPGTGDDCSDGEGSFQNCLDFASSNGEGDILLVQAGTYNVASTFIYSPSPLENFPLTIQNATSSLPVITSGNTVGCMELSPGLLNPSADDNADVVVSGLVFTQCSSNEDGAGLTIFGYDADITVSNCQFTENTSTEDGGALNTDSLNTGYITVMGNQFTGNTAELAGAFSMGAYGGDALVADNQFTDNTATLFSGGGAGVFSLMGTLTISGNVFSINRSGFGGGGLASSLESGTLVIVNNIFSGNQAGNDPSGSSANTSGGGLSVSTLGGNGTVTVTNNTLFGNISQESGGGLAIGLDEPTDTANIYNNIVFGNSAALDGEDIYSNEDEFGGDDGGVLNLFNNDFDSGGFFSECLNGSVICAGVNGADSITNITLNPLFVDAAAGNFSLSADSPCIDAGDPSAPDMPSTDILGNPRPAVAGSNPDMGAVEFQPEPSPSPTPSPTATPAPGPISGGGGCQMNPVGAGSRLSWLWLALAAVAVLFRRNPVG